MLRLAFFFLLSLPFPLQANAAEFVAVKTTCHGAWCAHLFRNTNGNRLFCALEARSAGTDFRINQYKESGETFLEIFNEQWTLMPGASRFALEFEVGSESYKAEFAGKSWGDSYTHDFTDVKNYQLVLGLIAEMRSVTVLNSNGSRLADFSGDGSGAALQAYGACVNG